MLEVTPKEGSSGSEDSCRSGDVLVVSPSFFGYEQDIAQEFGRQAASVQLLDERPSNSTVMRAALRLRLRVTEGLVRRHFERAADRLVGKRLSTVLIVKGESTPRWFLERLREDHPGLRIVFYAYDRIVAGQNCLDILPVCDAAYTFDHEDAERLGIGHKPLFAGPAFKNLTSWADRRYDVTFIGTAHSDRYRYVKAVAQDARHPYLFFYSPARWYLALQKLGRRTAGAVPWREVSFAKLSKRRVAEVFGDSRVVVDLQRDGQTGLTMRTFEVLASGARLITSNPSVRLLDCFDPADILVVRPNEVADARASIREFIEAPGDARADASHHSLRTWVRDLLEAA